MNRCRHRDRHYLTNFKSTADEIPEHQQAEEPPDNPPGDPPDVQGQHPAGHHSLPLGGEETQQPTYEL